MTKVFVETAPVARTSAWRSACEVGRAVGPLLGLPDAARSGTLDTEAVAAVIEAAGLLPAEAGENHRT